MISSCRKVFAQRGHFLFNKDIYICNNNPITFKDHVLSRKHQIAEQTVKWEQQGININPTQ